MLETWEIMERAKVDAWVALATQDIDRYLRHQGTSGLFVDGLVIGCAKRIQEHFEESDRNNE